MISGQCADGPDQNRWIEAEIGYDVVRQDPRASLTLSDRKLRACAARLPFIEAITLSSILLSFEIRSRCELCGQYNAQ